MTLVQDVEAAVGHDDPLADGARRRDRVEQCRSIQEAVPLRAPIGALQLASGDRRRPEFADRDAGCAVGQRAGFVERDARAQRGRQGRDHRVAGTGDVEDLASPRRQVQCFGLRAQQQHAALAERDQHGLKVKLGTQPLAPLDEHDIVGADPDDRFQLGPVRGQERGAAVACEIQSLGIDEHRFAARKRERDEPLRVGQRPFGIVRKEQEVAGIERSRKPAREAGRRRAASRAPRSPTGSAVDAGSRPAAW